MFDFEPSVIMVSGKGYYQNYGTFIAVIKSPLSTIIKEYNPFNINVKFNGNQVSWYTPSDDASWQANEGDSTYSYVVID